MTQRKHAPSPLFLHDYFNVPLLETKASIKANGSVAEPFSNGNLLLVACPACFRNVLQPPITDSLLFASL
jgi:hypothetical protein